MQVGLCFEDRHTFLWSADAHVSGACVRKDVRVRPASRPKEGGSLFRHKKAQSSIGLFFMQKSKPMNYYVYALKSKTRKYIYVGLTDNVERRLGEHNRGKSKTTKPYRPFQLIYSELFSSRVEARLKEKFLMCGFRDKSSFQGVRA